MNTRKRNRLLYGAGVVMLAAAVTYACKDFLNGNPVGTLNEETLANKAGVEGSLIAAYRSLDCSSSSGSWGCAASNWVWGSVTSDDAYKGSESNDQQPINSVELYNWAVSDADAYINDKWRQVYEGVSRANATLGLLAKVQAEKPGEISDADANGIRGEALFLRAHYHFEAFRMWGNVPYYREDDTDFRKANEDTTAVLGDILQDLNEAITLLPDIPRGGDKGRATSWAAKAYKGRVQVYARDFAGALTTLHELYDNGANLGPYALETSFDHVWTGFTNLENGPETILAFEASVRDGEPNGYNSNWGERLNFPHSGSHFGCCGFHQPSQNLVNFFAVDANGLPLALTAPNWNADNPAFFDPITAQNFHGGLLAPAVDPRLDWTVGRDSVPYKDWGLHSRGWIRQAPYGGPYSPKKNVHEAAADAEDNVGWVPTQTNDVNIHLFRYGDMLLLLAEAEVEAGVLEKTRTIVNQIRTRAAQAAQWCGADTVALAYSACAGDTRMAVPLVHPAVGPDTLTAPWAAYRIGLYTVPWTDQAFARRAVRYERRLELAMEGQRFFDLRRWGDADTVINNFVAVEKNRRNYLTAAATFTSRHHFYPIPTIQIELSRVGSADRLVQNPGW